MLSSGISVLLYGLVNDIPVDMSMGGVGPGGITGLENTTRVLHDRRKHLCLLFGLLHGTEKGHLTERKAKDPFWPACQKQSSRARPALLPRNRDGMDWQRWIYPNSWIFSGELLHLLGCSLPILASPFPVA